MDAQQRERSHARVFLVGFENSIKLGLLSAIIPGVLGIFLAYAIQTSKSNTLRRLCATASGVLANFGGINLTFIFIATLGSTGVLRYWLQDVGIKLTSIGFNLYTFSEDFERPKTAFVAQFVGISSRVSVVVTGHEVEAFGQRCPVRSGDSSAVTGAADALLRPEDIAIEVDPDGKGFVTRKSFLGAMTRLVVQIGEISVRVDVRSDVGSEIELGSHVRASIVARDVLVAPRKEVVVADEVAAQ